MPSNGSRVQRNQDVDVSRMRWSWLSVWGGLPDWVRLWRPGDLLGEGEGNHRSVAVDV